MAVLYKHLRKDNNEVFYIGIGKTNKRASSKYSRNKYWHNIVNKVEYYIEIVDSNLSWEDACLKEIELIKLYGRQNNNTGILVNMTIGGDGVVGLKWTEEQRIKRSGINSHLYGKKYTKERLEKISGKKSYFYGKTWNEEERKSISNRMMGNKNASNRKITDDYRELISNLHSKSIIQLDKNLMFIKEWKSIRKAANQLGINEKAITECLRGRNKTSGGFKWKYNGTTI